jgi:hypothetical protein
MNTKTKCLLAVIVTFLPFMAKALAPLQGTCSSTNPYNYGDTGPDGGIVFHIDEDGCTGAEAQPYDVGATKSNGYRSTTQNYADATKASNAYNTTVITKALHCRSSADNPTNDFCWHLSRIEELEFLHMQYQTVGNFVAACYTSQTYKSGYDTSIHYSAIMFGTYLDGTSTTARYDTLNHDRAVRVFNANKQ